MRIEFRGCCTFLLFFFSFWEVEANKNFAQLFPDHTRVRTKHLQLIRVLHASTQNKKPNRHMGHIEKKGRHFKGNR